jgi:large subunit ribosomal protein L13
LLVRRPEKILEEAIKGMLPKSKLGRQMATKLKVYKGADHPHHAQQPTAMELHRSGTPMELHRKQEHHRKQTA